MKFVFRAAFAASLLMSPAPTHAQNLALPPCAPHHTAPGASCACNHKVMRSRKALDKPGWHLDERQHMIRDGWHATYYKGTHNAVCSRS